jgi:YHS domain-containing protein
MRTIHCALLITAVLLAGCGSGTSSASKQYVNTDGYPLDYCVVSGEKLGKMGEPFRITYQGKTVKFCCSACLKEFNTNPEKYAAIVEDARRKAAEVKPEPATTK